MGLGELVKQHKAAILKKWFDVVADAYQLETAGFLKNQKDPFANPVGNSLIRGMEGIIDELAGGPEREAVIRFLDPVIRIRAVQDFSPSQAVGFILPLKKIIREFVKNQDRTLSVGEDLGELEEQIDVLMLLGFDIYMGCRERLYDIKANQEKSKVYKAFKRAGLLTETPDGDSGLAESNV
ncbi:MAG: RsbRD N-terminal domain-containing protein [Thermodesulfobacteriota bacterium]